MCKLALYAELLSKFINCFRQKVLCARIRKIIRRKNQRAIDAKRSDNGCFTKSIFTEDALNPVLIWIELLVDRFFIKL